MTDIPKNEICWVGYYDELGNLRYVVTSKNVRDIYYLYKINNDSAVRLGKAKDPTKLVKDHSVIEDIRKLK